jgi:aspartate carbamoyltransferase catalytic subunit
VSKGESLKDTALTLQAMGADAVVIRHNASGAAKRLADSEWTRGSVVNAGDGTHEHPSQALLDAFTIRKHLAHGSKTLEGLHIAIVGDVLHSRVARSNVLLLTKLGAKVTLIAPPTLLPVGIQDWPAEISYSFDEVLPRVDALMMLRIQMERMNESFFPSSREYSHYFGLNKSRLQMMKASSIVMHPGPMNRGLEITADAADSARSVIVEQVSNGISIRMAILYLLLAGEQ